MASEHPNQTTEPPSPAPEREPSVGGRLAIAACAAVLTAGITIAVRPSEPPPAEHATALPPPILPMPVQEQEPVAPVSGAHFARTFDVSAFRRGNIHTHSNRSDGDSDPADVYQWYRDHGYDFVAITDHNTFTDPAGFHAVEGMSFLALGGEEVTMRGAGRQVHVNALCTHQNLSGGKFATASDALTHGVREIVEAGGIALINHPNFTWGIKANDLPAAHGARLIEIQSGHPNVRTLGDSAHPSHEELWDMGLTAGLDMMGVAVDDAHHLHNAKRRLSHPGRAWIEVAAASLDESSICRSLEQGLLYASTGPSLARINVSEDTYTIWPNDHDMQVQFVGFGGRVIADHKLATDEASASYKLVGAEGYVRARVLAPDGKAAWTPAVRVIASGQANVTVATGDKRPPG